LKGEVKGFGSGKHSLSDMMINLMNKHTMVILCLMLAVGSCFALPSSYSSKGNPALCKQLMYKAETNLKLLPNDIKQQYQALLQEHPDAVMAYLLAYESDSNLAAAKPEYVHNNYLQIVNLLDSRKPKLSPEFFLSYVAKQTVSDEAITPYRKALLDDGLQDILDENTQELELFQRPDSSGHYPTLLHGTL